MKVIRTLACVTLGICAYVTPILAAVNCQCYAYDGCGPTPEGCSQHILYIVPECKQFCTTLCNTPPVPNITPPLYDSGCCMYTKITYKYEPVSQEPACIDPGNCTSVFFVTYSASKQCKIGSTVGNCLQILSSGSCQQN